MSIELMTKVWKTDIGPATKRLVLLALADGASDTGELWPYLGTLAAKVGISKSSLREWVRRLEIDGLLSRTFRTDQSNIYRINVEMLDRLVSETQRRAEPAKTPTDQPVAPHRPAGAPPTGESVHPHRSAGAPPTGRPVPEPSLNPQGTFGSAAAPTPEINAGFVVARWCEIYEDQIGRKPNGGMRGQVGKEAKQWLGTHDPKLVLDAAEQAARKGYPTLSREISPLVAKQRQAEASERRDPNTGVLIDMDW